MQFKQVMMLTGVVGTLLTSGATTITNVKTTSASTTNTATHFNTQWKRGLPKVITHQQHWSTNLLQNRTNDKKSTAYYRRVFLNIGHHQHFSLIFKYYDYQKQLSFQAPAFDQKFVDRPIYRKIAADKYQLQLNGNTPGQKQHHIDAFLEIKMLNHDQFKVTQIVSPDHDPFRVDLGTFQGLQR